MKPLIILILSITLFVLPTQGQNKTKVDSAKSIMIFDAGYAYQIPGGDLVNRFGNNSNMMAGFTYKTSKNWLWGINGQFIFGSNIKELDVLRFLRTSDGFIISSGGTIATVVQYQRGYIFNGTVGKLIPLSKKNKNSGIYISVGGGFINHKIRIEVDNNNVWALTKEYKRGYDRKTNGLMVSQFVGYRHMSKNQMINFFAGFEFVQGFTRGRRPVNFDTGLPDHTPRLDLLSGFRIGWSLPIYRRDPNAYYYY